MTEIMFKGFRGIEPVLDPCLQDTNVADIAHNVKLWHGRLDPWRTPAVVKSVDNPVAAHVRDCCWRVSTNPCTRYVDVLCGPTIVSSPTTLPTAVDNWCDPNDAGCPLGFPCPEAPTTQPVITTAECHTDHVRSYLIAYGDECNMGAPSELSEPVYCSTNEDVVTINLPAGPSSIYCNVSKVYIYRLVTTLDVENAHQHGSREHRTQGDASPLANDAECFLVACVDVGTDSWTDTGHLKDSEHGDVLTTEDFDEPPCGLLVHGMFDSGALVGSIGNMLRFSEFNTHYAWPCKYEISFDCDIIEVCVCDTFAFVFTEQGVEIVDDRIEALDDFCRPKRSVKRALPLLNHKAVVCLNRQAIFASKNGLYRVTADGQVQNLTGIMGTDNWAQMDPASMRLGLYENRLMITSNRFSGVYDIDVFNDGTPASNTLTTIDACPTCWINDKQGNLFYLDNEGIWAWDQGETCLCMHWRSAERNYDGFGYLTAARIDHKRPFGRKQKSQHATDVSIYADGCKVYGRSVNHNEPFRTPKCKAHSYAVEVMGDRSVTAVTLGASIRCMGEASA